ncbi:hypothetical protein [Amycolatopsis anabasis]|uniref:hypothetical protein n=1 Tax=Amycolatopsis anabasis TaxID=1840409 RepID=UPI00131C45E4|nr:hypothetical protein [Amycolatopsis anabasis]
MPDKEGFARVLFLAVDAWRYGARDDLGQSDVQDALVNGLAAAAGHAGLEQSCWEVQNTGDGVLALLPSGDAEPKLVDPFVRALDEWLWRYNRDRVPAARLRLRVAVHHGVAYQASCGFAGQGAVHVARLVDARPVRDALAGAPDRNLVLAISKPVFDDVVCQGHTALRPEDFVPVEVHMAEKGFRAPAWIRVPGVDPQRLANRKQDVDPELFALSLSFDFAPDPGSLEEVVDRSFEAAGLDRPALREVAGNEVLIVLREGVSGTRVLGVWVECLDEALRARGTSATLGVDFGPVIGDGPRIRGLAAERARGLAASPRVADVFAAARGVRLAVVVSDLVHRSVVRRGGRFVSPESYRPVEAGPRAWFRVLGYSVPPPPAAASRGATEPRDVEIHGNGTVIDHGEFGHYHNGDVKNYYGDSRR